jgi:hypothetical protein
MRITIAVVLTFVLTAFITGAAAVRLLGWKPHEEFNCRIVDGSEIGSQGTKITLDCTEDSYKVAITCKPRVMQ